MKTLLKRSVLVVIGSLFVMLMSSYVVAASDDVLLIRACQNLYANLYHDISVPEDAYELTLEARFRIDGEDGASFATGAWLYQDNVSSFGAQFWYGDPPYVGVFGSGTFNSLGLAIYDEAEVRYGEWFELKVVFQPFYAQFYGKGASKTDWVLLYEATVFEAPPVITGIVIGKGYADPDWPLEKRRNSYSDPGPATDVYVDYVVVRVDGEVILEESFDTSIADLEAAGWDMEADPLISDVRYALLDEDLSTPLFEMVPRP